MSVGKGSRLECESAGVEREEERDAFAVGGMDGRERVDRGAGGGEAASGEVQTANPASATNETREHVVLGVQIRKGQRTHRLSGGVTKAVRGVAAASLADGPKATHARERFGSILRFLNHDPS